MQTCWDMRFRLPIVNCCHPSESRIRQLVAQPGPYVLASVQGNNEVGLWNMESQFRQLALWASAAPILSKDRVRRADATVCATFAKPRFFFLR